MVDPSASSPASSPPSPPTAQGIAPSFPPPQPSPLLPADRSAPSGSELTVVQRRPPRPGELALPWRAAVLLTWVLVFLAYMGVWKASEEIGIGTWWLGPRSNPQPIIVRLVPFIVATAFGAIASFSVRWLPWISLAGSLVLAALAVPDFSRAVGLAVTELAIAGAVALVSLASLSGRYRAVSNDGPDPHLPPDAPAGGAAPAR